MNKHTGNNTSRSEGISTGYTECIDTSYTENISHGYTGDFLDDEDSCDDAVAYASCDLAFAGDLIATALGTLNQATMSGEALTQRIPVVFPRITTILESLVPFVAQHGYRLSKDSKAYGLLLKTAR